MLVDWCIQHASRILHPLKLYSPLAIVGACSLVTIRICSQRIPMPSFLLGSKDARSWLRCTSHLHLQTRKLYFSIRMLRISHSWDPSSYKTWQYLSRRFETSWHRRLIPFPNCSWKTSGYSKAHGLHSTVVNTIHMYHGDGIDWRTRLSPWWTVILGSWWKTVSLLVRDCGRLDDLQWGFLRWWMRLLWEMRLTYPASRP